MEDSGEFVDAPAFFLEYKDIWNGHMTRHLSLLDQYSFLSSKISRVKGPINENQICFFEGCPVFGPHKGSCTKSKREKIHAYSREYPKFLSLPLFSIACVFCGEYVYKYFQREMFQGSTVITVMTSQVFLREACEHCADSLHEWFRRHIIKRAKLIIDPSHKTHKQKIKIEK